MEEVRPTALSMLSCVYSTLCLWEGTQSVRVGENLAHGYPYMATP